jgi:predicted TIM-barrel fold metal-dependent hydrolase
VPIIDSYTLLGVWPESEIDLSVDALAQAMQARGVGRSLVTHTSAIFYDTTLGNDTVIQVCSQHAPLTPVAVINPLEYPRSQAEIERCLGKGVQVFRLCPREHGYPLSGAVGPLREAFRALESAKLLLIDIADMPAPGIAAGVEDLLPVPTVLTVDGEELGTVIHAGKSGPNVWVDTSRLSAGGAIETAVQHLGASRVVFGSGSPLLVIGSAVMAVQYAELSEADRNAVFEGNLQRVLG